ncbi:gsdA, partial [Symbiodinium sp. KB8]
MAATTSPGGPGGFPGGVAESGAADHLTAIPDTDTLSIFVIGASGDLAKKKTFPAIFELFQNGFLPSKVAVVGYSRSSISDADFREHIAGHLTGDAEDKAAFLQKCFYRNGQYDSEEGFATAVAFAKEMEAPEGAGSAHRLFYFAIPPSVFAPISSVIHAVGLDCSGWSRPVWNRHHINTVTITFKEPFGTEGRGGYFDKVGILRDVMQNHLLQVMSLVAMETPVSLDAEAVRDEKVKVLRCVPPLDLAN